MNQNLQFGNHPDAESLNAFAEQALPSDEREQILAHMASCGRCRQVVFLARETADTESFQLVAAAAQQLTEHSSSLPGPSLSRSPEPVVQRWLAGWRWVWIPVAAMAGILSVVVFQNLRRTPQDDKVAQNTQAESREQKPVASTTPAKPAAPEVTNKAENYLDAQAPAAKRPQNRPEDKKSATSSNGPVAQAASGIGRGGIGFAAPPIQLGQPMARHEVNGMVSSVGGPAKPAQFGQQQAEQQQATQQQATPQQTSGAQRLQVAGALYSAAASDAVVVESSPTSTNGLAAKSKANPAPPAPLPSPAPRREMALKSSAGTGYGFGAGGALSTEEAKNTVLPNGMSALSVATNQGHTIAIDATGALFLSEDAGKSWIPISRQWTGRAFLVRTREVPPVPGVASAQQVDGFELVNDKLETWASQNGKTWVAQTTLLK